MGSIKLPHASGNSMSIAAPATNPASDLELKLPATIGSAGQVLRNSSTPGTLEFGGLGGGITQVDEWRVNANFTTANAEGITSNWERNDNSTFSLIGSGMSESSGSFTFPETGVWKVDWHAMGGVSGTQVRYVVADILYTTDNWSSQGQIAFGNGSISNDTNANSQSHASSIFDVTNTSTHKLKFTCYAEVSITWECSSTANSMYATFIRLGDT